MVGGDVADHRVALVGGGAAATAAARVLIESNIPFGWFCGGGPPTSFNPIFSNISDFRQTHGGVWNELVGDDLAVDELLQSTSPKNRTHRFRADTAGYTRISALEANGFYLRGALVQGGLTNFWGAEVQLFDETDMPLRADVWRQLQLSYRRIAAWLPITGAPTHVGNGPEGYQLVSQPMMPHPRAAQHILAACKKERPKGNQSDRVNIRPSLLAVRTVGSAGGGGARFAAGVCGAARNARSFRQRITLKAFPPINACSSTRAGFSIEFAEAKVASC